MTPTARTTTAAPDATPDPGGVGEGSIVHFPNGLPGFERCRRFVLVSSEDLAPLKCLHGLDDPRPTFLAIDPCLVLRDYRRALSDRDRVPLAAASDTPLVWLAIVTFSDGEATVNLRAPVVINPAAMVGLQSLPRHAVYPLRHPLRLG